MKGYIYIITNLKNNMQYVGQTMKTIQQRFSGHKTSAKNGLDNMYLHRAMNKYGIENFNVKEITSVDCETQEELSSKLNSLEIYYIEKFNTLVPNGYNLTKGGTEGAESYKVKVDEYDLIGNYIQTHDSLIEAARYINIEHSDSIIKCCNGESKFAYQRVWRYYGEPFDKFEAPDLKFAKRDYKLAPIDQYKKNGTFIKSFNSIVEAYISLGVDKTSSHISECCDGKLCTAYGYVWRYKGEPFDKYQTKDNRFVGCEKYDLNDNLLGSYSSIQDACYSIGKEQKTATPNIIGCCAGRKKTAYGYKWKYITA